MTERLVFDHVGVPTDIVQPNENWIEVSRVWVTNPRHHIESIEFLRFEPDSQVPEPVRKNPHVAFRVARLEPHLEGQQIIIPPFDVAGFVRAAFILKHGTIFEYMMYYDENRWFGETGA